MMYRSVNRNHPSLTVPRARHHRANQTRMDGWVFGSSLLQVCSPHEAPLQSRVGPPRILRLQPPYMPLAHVDVLLSRKRHHAETYTTNPVRDAGNHDLLLEKVDFD